MRDKNQFPAFDEFEGEAYDVTLEPYYSKELQEHYRVHLHREGRHYYVGNILRSTKSDKAGNVIGHLYRPDKMLTAVLGVNVHLYNADLWAVISLVGMHANANGTPAFAQDIPRLTESIKEFRYATDRDRDTSTA